MLPRKRAWEGEIGEEDSDSTTVDSLNVKKRRIAIAGAAGSAVRSRKSCNFNRSSGRDSGAKGKGGHLLTMVRHDADAHDIDEDLHSRQLAVYGRDTMRRLFASNVLVSGMKGLGAEIAKNLILAGVKSVTVHDEGKVELWDLSGNFIFSESNIGKNRALASVQKLQELNNVVVVQSLTTKLTKEQLTDFQIGFS